MRNFSSISLFLRYYLGPSCETLKIFCSVPGKVSGCVSECMLSETNFRSRSTKMKNCLLNPRTFCFLPIESRDSTMLSGNEATHREEA